MSALWLIVGTLGVWRVTHLLAAEDGPWDLMSRLRKIAGDGWWAGLLDCFYCLSMWTAAVFAIILGANWREKVLLWPALSGAAILLERATAREERPATARYVEAVEPAGDEDALLRR
ncbi:MAG TPA: hypothetical protein VN684_12105 [Terriglobales bacterium]|nr:hypothetical protein [Terriglobales bacterium]